MTQLTLDQVAYYWEHNSGSTFEVVDAVSVALAESGGETTAVSPSDDHGLWQINRIHFGTLGLNDQNVLDPNVNAWAAWVISSHGANWAPWCTAWVDPSNCGHGSLPHPQAGSPAGSNISYVAHALGTGQTAPPSPVYGYGSAPPSGSHDGINAANSAWGYVQGFLNGDANSRYRKMNAIYDALGRINP